MLGGNVRVSAHINPDPSGLPVDLESQVASLIDQAGRRLAADIEAMLADHQQNLDKERGELTAEEQKQREENKELIAKHAANSEIETLIKERQAQEKALAAIDR